MHDGHGHFGRDATFCRLRGSYWWPRAYTDVKEYVEKCHICQIFDRMKPPSGPIFPLKIDQLFEQFGLDFVGPLPETNNGNKYILVCTEYYTRWPLAKAVNSADSKVVARFLSRKFSVFLVRLG